MKISYKSKLFLYFFAVFALFTAMVLIFQQIREKRYKRELIESRLDIYSYLVQNDAYVHVLPENLRVTIIDNGGKVLYDNQVENTPTLNNHFDRSEVQKAKTHQTGSDIRLSDSLNRPFFYYARKIDNGFIRMAIPYDEETQLLLKSDNSFLLFALFLFVISLFFLWMIARRFGLDVERLKTDVVAQQQARATLKMEMTSSIAHELRTPVSAIRGYMETLLDREMPEDKRNAFIERTYLSAVRLSDLLQDIALLTKIEEANHQFRKEDVNLHTLVESITEEMEQSIHANSVQVKNKLPEELAIKGNATLLNSIFRNLIENALRYAGKWITVTIELTKEDEQYYYFSVCDTGTGIPEHFLPRIFERFYRVNDGRSREDGGSGLGLSIVLHAVKYHEGQISAENNSSGGLRVNFSLRK